MKKQYKESDVWTWLESRDFSQLTAEEKSVVLELHTEKEYQDMRKLSLSLQQELQELPEGLQVPDAQAIFQQGKQERISLVKRLAQYQIPAWKAAAAAIFFACTFYVWGFSSQGRTENFNQVQNSTDSLIGISLAEDSSLSRFMIEAF